MAICFNKRLLLFIFIFIVSNFTFAIPSDGGLKIDSLQNKLLHSTKLEKAIILYEIAKQSASSDSCIPLINDAKDFSKQNDFDTLYLKSLLLQIKYYQKTGAQELAIKHALEGIDVAKRIRHNGFLIKLYSLLPYSYSVLGEYTSQYESMLNLLSLAEKTGDTLHMLLAHNSKATFYWHINELDKAIIENKIAFELSKKLTTFKKGSIILLNRSVYYFANKKYPEALKILNEAEKIALTKGDSNHINQNIGITYYLMDSINLAIKYLDRTFEYYKNTNEQGKIQTYYQYRAYIYYKKGNYKKASFYFNLLIQNYQLSISEREKVYDFKYRIAKHNGEIDSALVFHEKYMLFSDSVSKMNNVSELKSRKWKESLLTKELENNLLIKKIEAEKKISLLSIIIITLVSFALILLLIVYFKNKKITLITHNNKVELKNKELFLLKTQRINRSKKIEDLYKKIEDLRTILQSKQVDSPEVTKILSSISRKIDFDTEKDWEEFKIYFEKLNSNFFLILREKYPKITKNDEKLCSFIKMNMDSKQIARILNVLPSTIVQQRNRLRKKMNLPPNSDIRNYLDFN